MQLCKSNAILLLFFIAAGCNEREIYSIDSSPSNLNQVLIYGEPNQLFKSVSHHLYFYTRTTDNLVEVKEICDYYWRDDHANPIPFVFRWENDSLLTIAYNNQVMRLNLANIKHTKSNTCKFEKIRRKI